MPFRGWRCTFTSRLQLLVTIRFCARRSAGRGTLVCRRTCGWCRRASFRRGWRVMRLDTWRERGDESDAAACLYYGSSRDWHCLSAAFAACGGRGHGVVDLHADSHCLARSETAVLGGGAAGRLHGAGDDAWHADGLLCADDGTGEWLCQPDPSCADWRATHGFSAAECSLVLAHGGLVRRAGGGILCSWWRAYFRMDELSTAERDCRCRAGAGCGDGPLACKHWDFLFCFGAGRDQSADDHSRQALRGDDADADAAYGLVVAGDGGSDSFCFQCFVCGGGAAAERPAPGYELFCAAGRGD